MYAHHVRRQAAQAQLRESLDGALALQELERIGVSNLVTFDAHDPRIQNAVPLMGFDNVMPSYQVLKTLFRSFPDLMVDPDHFMIISPTRAPSPAICTMPPCWAYRLASIISKGFLPRVVRGRNPIVAHEYLGQDVTGKDVFVADDIISTPANPCWISPMT